MFWLLLPLFILTVSAQKDSPQGSCPKLDVVEATLSGMFKSRFTYLSYMEKRKDFLDIDNICYTLEPAPQDNNTFIVYGSVVRSNGKNEVRTFVATQLNKGTIRSAAPDNTETQYGFANLKCGTSVAYLCTEHGNTKSYVYGLTLVRKKISDSCLQEAQKAVSDLGLTENGVFALPMKLPSKCVVRPSTAPGGS